MNFLIALAYFVNLMALFVVLTDKEFALSIAIRTRGDLVKVAIPASIPGLNIIVAVLFMIEYIPYAYPMIVAVLNEVFDKEL